MCIKLPIVAHESERGERAAESNFPPKSKSGDDAIPKGRKNGPYKKSSRNYNGDGNRNIKREIGLTNKTTIPFSRS